MDLLFDIILLLAIWFAPFSAFGEQWNKDVNFVVAIMRDKKSENNVIFRLKLWLIWNIVAQSKVVIPYVIINRCPLLRLTVKTHGCRSRENYIR